MEALIGKKNPNKQTKLSYPGHPVAKHDYMITDYDEIGTAKLDVCQKNGILKQWLVTLYQTYGPRIQFGL